MGQFLVNGAVLTCSFGVAPCNLVVSAPKVASGGNHMANIMDYTSANVPTFSMCTSMANPAVAAQSGAPTVCTPAIVAPWSPGIPTVLVRNMPAVDNTCKLNCSFGGVINVAFAGQVKVIT
jgi:hypothetical protein